MIVPDSLELPNPRDTVEGATFGDVEEREISDVYYDAVDLRLARSGAHGATDSTRLGPSRSLGRRTASSWLATRWSSAAIQVICRSPAERHLVAYSRRRPRRHRPIPDRPPRAYLARS